MSSSKNSSSSNEAPLPFGRCLQEVRFRVDVVLGTSSMSLRQCLALRPDTVIRLNQASGAKLQVLVRGIPIAAGEVAVIDERATIRITDILPPSANAQ
jgi:flagellar motor switch protein FliN/FliY